MKSITTIFCLFIVGLHLASCDEPADKVIESPTDSSEWNLVWWDEFEGDGPIDPDKWDQPEYNRRNNDDGPDGWWLREDSYHDGEGNLVIRARLVDNLNSDDDPYDYATGAIRSIGRFEQRFGKFEVRCKMPSLPGWWVAFWLMSPSVFNENGSGEDGTEIDIMEGFGWTDVIHHNLHWDGYGEAHRSAGFNQPIEGIREGFHTFTLEWSAAEYVFFVDGTETYRTNAGGVSKVPAYVKITGELSTIPNMMSEWWANEAIPGYFPDYFIIDYVRVWERKENE
jgi:beta-glucanase (GH16 family)